MKNPALSLPSGPATSRWRGASRVWFRDMLWRAFPSRSEKALAAKAAPVLGVSERQVINWLRGEHDAALRHVLAVIVIAGAEIVFNEEGE